MIYQGLPFILITGRRNIKAQIAKVAENETWLKQINLMLWILKKKWLLHFLTKTPNFLGAMSTLGAPESVV